MAKWFWRRRWKWEKITDGRTKGRQMIRKAFSSGELKIAWWTIFLITCVVTCSLVSIDRWCIHVALELNFVLSNLNIRKGPTIQNLDILSIQGSWSLRRRGSGIKLGPVMLRSVTSVSLTVCNVLHVLAVWLQGLSQPLLQQIANWKKTQSTILKILIKTEDISYKRHFLNISTCKLCVNSYFELFL